MFQVILSVTEAKKRFSELVDRVVKGEQFIVHHNGKPVVALVPLTVMLKRSVKPVGLASAAGALSDWDDLESFIEEIYTSRRKAPDRSIPDLE